MSQAFFAITPPGLEAVVARELETLGHRGKPVQGGVDLNLPITTGAPLACRLRTATRLLMRIGHGRVRSADDLARLIRAQRWRDFLDPRSKVEVSVTSRGSRLRHREQIRKKTQLTIRDALRRAPRSGRWPSQVQHLAVRIVDDVATLSLDAGGAPLHQRGWRKRTGAAPLRETFAAAMLVAAGYTGDEPLLDPFCGSGTLPIEAARLAGGQPPWTRRGFAWEEWPVLSKTRRPKVSAHKPAHPIVGSDRDPHAIDRAQSNAQRAKAPIQWSVREVARVVAPADGGLVVANPPYGHRLEHGSDKAYRGLGQALAGPLTGWRAVFLAPDERQARLVSPRTRRVTAFPNGGLRVGVYTVDPL